MPLKSPSNLVSVRTLLCAATMSAALIPLSANAGVILAGNATTNIATALTALGVSYTTAGTTMPGSVASGDTLILSFDGGSGPYANYTSALNAGADVIVFGGSCDGGGFSGWIGQYINNTGNNCWHTDGKWNTLAVNTATQFMPNSYLPQDVGVTYHMTHLLATADTVMLGRNDEGNDIAAFRTYANGGSFNYLAMDPGRYGTAGDSTSFTMPYLRGALAAAANGIGGNEVPEPGTLALVGIALLGGAALRRRVGR